VPPHGRAGRNGGKTERGADHRHPTPPFAFANAKYERACIHYDDHEALLTRRRQGVSTARLRIETKSPLPKKHVPCIRQRNNFVVDYAVRNCSSCKSCNLCRTFITFIFERRLSQMHIDGAAAFSLFQLMVRMSYIGFVICVNV